ncbi:MAG TPA: 3-dehydroquinate synthase II [Candidatus Bathyarchaeia archaeon]|nr:3-dehydroquinate synthase II [Candidatus Bathyarchaeia archaeon]
MRELWLRVDPSLSKAIKERLLKAGKGKVSAVILEGDDLVLAQGSGLKVVSKETQGDIFLIERPDERSLKKTRAEKRRTAVHVSIERKEDVDNLVEVLNKGPIDYVLISCKNWKVIPLENIIAAIHGKSRLLAEVASASEAKAAMETLEVGADGAVLRTDDPREILLAASLMNEVKTRPEEKEEESTIQLEAARITATRELSMGARACVDTCDMMKAGEGLLLGSSSSALFLIQAEVLENPHVAARPFRVNAGPVSLYSLVPGKKTRYVSELKAGEDVLIADRKGKTRRAVVGRLKIEWRPLMLVEAEYKERKIKTIVQNAETIHFVTPEGSKSVTELKPGDEVLVHVEEGGRHFGTLVKEETIIER